MDIVDAQVHANMLGTEITLAIMDALSEDEKAWILGGTARRILK